MAPRRSCQVLALTDSGSKNCAAKGWKTIEWRNGKRKLLKAKVLNFRVRIAGNWRKGRPLDECWLLIEKRTNETKYFLSNLPVETSLQKLVEITHQRWAVEQSYREIKNELTASTTSQDERFRDGNIMRF